MIRFYDDRELQKIPENHEIMKEDNSDYEDIALPCEADDFDPYVKHGRDGMLFVKR